MVRRKRVDERVEHPSRFLRFDPSEWPGVSLEDRRLVWADEFRRYWSDFALEWPGVPRPVEVRVCGSRRYEASHLMWLLNRLGESRRVVAEGG